MEWIQDQRDSSRPRWIPKSHATRLAKAKTLAGNLHTAQIAFKEAKRAKTEAPKLKKLKETRGKAQAAYDALRKEVVSKGFYIMQTGRGFVVRTWDGKKAQTVHPTLKEAQEQRPL